MAKKPDGNPKQPKAYCSSMAQAAALMGVSKQALRSAKAQGCPGFIGSRVYMDEVRHWLDTQAVKAPERSDAVTPRARDLKEEIDDLNVMLVQVDSVAKECMANGQLTTGLEYLSQRKSLSDQRNAAMVQMRRQGRTEDDSVPRQEVERITRAIARNAASGLQLAANKICDRLAGISDPVEMHPIVTDVLVSDVFVSPFEQACNLPAGHGVPSWVLDAVRAGVAGFVEP
jgi:hypothetical protein